MAYYGFKALKEKLKKSGAKNPSAVAASIGREKYGEKKFEKATHQGKKLGKK